MSFVSSGTRSFVLYFFVALYAGCNPTSDVETPPPTIQPGDQNVGFDGLPQFVFDSIGRYRNRGGIGSFSVIGFDGGEYLCQTNHHVADRKGSQGVADIWSGGDLVASVRTIVSQSWFDATKSKDVAEFTLKATELVGPLSVAPLAPYGHSKKSKQATRSFLLAAALGDGQEHEAETLSRWKTDSLNVLDLRANRRNLHTDHDVERRKIIGAARGRVAKKKLPDRSRATWLCFAAGTQRKVSADLA